MTGTESQEAAVVAEVQNHEEELQQPQKHLHRTSFHYQPVKNWMGDPNAPMYYKGYYHVFYQYNSVAAVWGNMSWGHAVSKDLIHWFHLESAMEPDQLYDARGVWSGSATIDPEGVPFVLYTGRAEEKLEQVQNMAVPADPSDPLLRKWMKVPHNPILKAHPGVAEHCFRDPSTAWQLSDGGWVVIVGAMIDGAGVALQYRSTDLKQWALEEKWLHSCAKSGMWECVDFFPIDHDIPTDLTNTQKYVFKASVFDETLDYYTVGTYDEVAQKFTPDDPKLDIGRGFRLDYGKYYAAKSFFDPVKNRRIMWAWVHESCTEEMNIRRGWSSLLGIPRTLALDSKTGVNLIQWPIEEVESLRGHKVSQTDVKLDAGAVVEVQGAKGDQLDVEVVFEYPDLSTVGVTDEATLNDECKGSQGGYAHQGIFGPFGLFVLTDENFQEQTALFFYIGCSSNGQWTVRFCNDQSRSSLLPDLDKPICGSSVTVLPTEDFLALRVLVDRSIVECFVQGGRMAVTSRVYPIVAIDNLANLYLFNNGMTPITVRSITAYQMKHVTMHSM